MEKLKQITIESRLTEARNETLKKVNQTSLRAFGKMHGNDVFAWINPAPRELASTIQSFPYPVFWLANANDVLKVCELLPELNDVSTVISYDNTDFYLDPKAKVDFIGCNDFEMAFSLSSIAASKRSVVLFTFSGENADANYNLFEKYIN